MQSLNNLFIKNFRLNKKDYLFLSLILAVYICSKIIDVFYAFNSVNLVQYADFEIHTALFLNDGWLPRTSLKDLYISPAAPFLILPPGMFYISKIIKVIFGNSYLSYSISIFLFQIFTPLLIYYLGRFFLKPVFALFLAILSTLWFTYTAILPDVWIQLLLILSVILFLKYVLFKRVKYLSVISFIVFIIIFLKHNIGLNFLVALSMALVLWNIKFFENKKEATKRMPVYVFFLFMIPFWVLVTKYVLTHLYFDEFIFYLLPSILLFGAISIYILKVKKLIYFNLSNLIRETSALYIPALLLIIIWLTIYSYRLGFPKYIYSLFGMCLKYLYIWDKGIIGLLKLENITINGFIILIIISLSLNKINKVARNLTFIVSVIWLCVSMSFWKNHSLFQLLKNSIANPFGVWNFFSCLILVFVAVVLLHQNKNINFKNIALLSIPIVGLWMYFPLDSDYILLTKSFLFWLPLFIFFQLIWEKRQASFYVCAIILIILLYLPTRNVVSNYQQIFTKKFSKISNKIGFKMKDDIAKEFRASIDLLKKNLGGNDFLVLDSTSTLREYYSFLDIKTKNYYIDNRTGFVDERIEQILKDYVDNKFTYVLINSRDYEQDFKKLPEKSVHLLINYLKENNNFKLIDKYTPPKENNDNHLLGYYLFKRK